jgi:hypothetical protein
MRFLIILLMPFCLKRLSIAAILDEKGGIVNKIRKEKA